MMIYLFDDPDHDDDLVLHMPMSPGSMQSACGRSFDDDDLYLPDPDQVVTDFCPVCAESWIDFKTTNTQKWKSR